MDKAGNLYGTTQGGGSFSNGTVFKVDPSGTESVLYSFKGPPDGSASLAGLIIDNAGNLYGTTFLGGSSGNCSFQGGGCGTVFKLAHTPVFAGQPGKPNCHGKSVSALSNQYGSLDAAASALGFPNVQALQDAIRSFCGR
jgi:uncharacterized repeat protein (TIGR03803 family)